MVCISHLSSILDSRSSRSEELAVYIQMSGARHAVNAQAAFSSCPSGIGLCVLSRVNDRATNQQTRASYHFRFERLRKLSFRWTGPNQVMIQVALGPRRALWAVSLLGQAIPISTPRYCPASCAPRGRSEGPSLMMACCVLRHTLTGLAARLKLGLTIP